MRRHLSAAVVAPMLLCAGNRAATQVCDPDVMAHAGERIKLPKQSRGAGW